MRSPTGHPLGILIVSLFHQCFQFQCVIQVLIADMIPSQSKQDHALLV